MNRAGYALAVALSASFFCSRPQAEPASSRSGLGPFTSHASAPSRSQGQRPRGQGLEASRGPSTCASPSPLRGLAGRLGRSTSASSLPDAPAVAPESEPARESRQMPSPPTRGHGPRSPSEPELGERSSAISTKGATRHTPLPPCIASIWNRSIPGPGPAGHRKFEPEGYQNVYMFVFPLFNPVAGTGTILRTCSTLSPIPHHLPV